VDVLDAIDRERIAALRARGEFFWLDLAAPTTEQIDELGELFALHPLAIEDTKEFDQRPKLDEYPGSVLLVFYGVHHAPVGEDAEPQPVEVHIYISGDFIITVHHDPCRHLFDIGKRLREQRPESEEYIVYRILDALTDSFFPLLSQVDDEIDELEDAMIQTPSEEQLHRIFSLKRELVALRRVVTPQRDLLASGGDLIQRVPGLEEDAAHDYFRDVYDHLIRISDLIDSFRDLLSGALDVYLSTQSNRMNQVMKQLTIIATIFLPLTFVSGFFGQNFGWLVNHIDGETSFLVYGIGGLVIPVILLYVYFRRSGFLER